MPNGNMVGSKLISRHGTVALRLDLLHDQRANFDCAAIGGPGFARVRRRVVGICDSHGHGPALRAAMDTLRDVLFEEIGVALGEIVGRHRDRLRRGRSDHRTVCSPPVLSAKTKLLMLLYRSSA